MQIAAPTIAPAKAGRLRGFIRKPNFVKGYAFVHMDDGSEFFLHASELKQGAQSMVSGRMIEFTPIETTVPGKKPRAISAELLA